jgi:acyl-CoA synthetase (AMP-forming)/AMP-acid ligase II
VINDANQVPLSPISFLARARRAFPTNTAAIDSDGSEVSCEQFAADCDALADALRARGVRPGERVAGLDFNTRWLLAAHFGVPGAGAVPVALNCRLTVADYEQILTHSRSRILLVSPALADKLGVHSDCPRAQTQTDAQLSRAFASEQDARRTISRGQHAFGQRRTVIGGSSWSSATTMSPANPSRLRPTGLYRWRSSYTVRTSCIITQDAPLR